MEVKSCIPFIITNEVEKIRTYFEKMGFSQAHGALDVNENHSNSYYLKDEKGNRITLIDSPRPQTLSGIKINVDDFDEAVECFKSLGFEIVDFSPVETGYAKSLMVCSPEGLQIIVTKHKK